MMQNFFAEILDTVFNGRPAPSSQMQKPTVNWDALIARKDCHVRYKGVIYHVQVTKARHQESNR